MYVQDQMKQIVVVSSWRSGSSLIGGLFDSHPGASNMLLRCNKGASFCQFFFNYKADNIWIVVSIQKMAIILPTGQWYAPSAVINVPWYCMVLHGIAWYCMVLHCIAWYCMVLHDIAWYCMVWHGIA